MLVQDARFETFTYNYRLAEKTVKSRYSPPLGGILAFQCLENVSYALTDSMNLNFKALEKFLKENENKTIFVFGFTYMIWLYFIKPLLETNEIKY